MMMLRRKNGLTLIELLLGLSLFGVMAVSLYLVFQNGLMVSRRAQEQSADDWQTFFAVELIAQDLENMVQYSNRSAGEGGLKGKENELSVIIAAEDGLKEVRYFLLSPEKTVIYKTEVRRVGAGLAEFKKQSAQAKSRAMMLVREVSEFPCQERPCKSAETFQEVASFRVMENGLKFLYTAGAGENQQGDLKWDPQWKDMALPLGVAVEINFIDPNGELAYTMSKRVLIPGGVFSGQKESGDKK